MMLLFNNVYLEVDGFMDVSIPRLVVSSTFGDTSTVQQRLRTDVSFNPPPVYQATTVQSLIEDHFGSDSSQLFTFLCANKLDKLVIYCDPSSFVQLAVKFWKTLLPTATVDSLYVLLNCAASHVVETMGNLTAPTIDKQAATSAREFFNTLLQAENEATVHTQLAAGTAFICSRQQRELMLKTCSLEYQLATVLVNPEWKYAAIMSNRLVSAVHSEMLDDFIQDCKHMILDGLVSFHYYEPDTSYSFFDHSLADLVTFHHEYRFLTDDLFTVDNLDYVLKSYDLEELWEIRAKTVDDQYDVGTDWKSLFKNNLQVDDIIDSSTTQSSFGKSGRFTQLMNPYLLDLILQANQSGSADLLNLFELN